eukprot:Colp12_sorted_trinity150504_noHs@10076
MDFHTLKSLLCGLFLLGLFRSVVSSVAVEAVVASSIQGESTGPVTLSFEHSFDIDATYQTRGSIQFAKAGKHRFVKHEWSEEQIASLKALASSGGFYRLRVKSDPRKEDSPYVVAIAPACQLLRSTSEVLTVHVDERGFVTAVTYTPSGSDCDENEVAPQQLLSRSAVIFETPSAGVTPFVENYVDTRSNKKEGKEVDNRSFIQKYWMYIVPGLLLMLLSSGGGDAPQGGQQRR